MFSNNPTVLIVHGAWHVPSHYRLLEKNLEQRGFEVALPMHPTCNNANLPNKTLGDDLAHIRHVATGLVAKQKSVIVLMHSYSGVVGTGALSGLMANPAKPDDGGIVAMVYMSALIPFEGESLAGIFGGKLPPWLTPDESTGLIRVEDPAMHFYSDLSPSEQEHGIKEQVVHPITAQLSPIASVSWREMSGRIWYLICEGDRGLPPFVQEMMIRD
ncbi:uncharacterized protein A1O9_05637 [Exophiala aquamarina CBS 119918]|uniref:AB hydrolase-1 domain-containing protein n=1 Tax=Exophiala aquamarina CBS 119918 TaxID=1182545 RepID=A0A072PCA3_9EURO|nr:uncharacterized protein A1O9_05637 [Exophiala aquamarina CBS 119918]KEF57719.1 hypothetical protein A1O9_05637 [Exophiala aquamarina CBS 119918]